MSYSAFSTCVSNIMLLHVQYIPRNIHTVFVLVCFVVVIHWLIFPYPSGLLHWHCGNLTIAPVSAKQPWWIWINTSFEFIMNDYITTTKQSTTKPCAYFLGYTVWCFGTIFKKIWPWIHHDTEMFSLTVFPSQFKFDGNYVSLSSRFQCSDRYKLLYMARQLCCRGMCKTLLRSDGQ